jgi:pimeloyl-ACP methyl ester carboxylesterase
MTTPVLPIANAAVLPDGVILPYVDHGDRDGVPVLMLHGYSDSCRSFEPILPHLPAGVRAIAVTQRGHGDASRPESGYGIRGLAADAIAVLDAIGLERAILLGHSLGSHVALRAALDAPERVAGLVLAGAYTTPSDVLYEFLGEVDALTDPVSREFAYEFQVSTLAQPIPEEWLELFVAETAKLPVRVWHGIAAAMRASHLDAELQRIAAPTLLLHGGRDELFVEPITGIAGARLIRYEHAGHALHWEEPERFAADVAAFALTR